MVKVGYKLKKNCNFQIEFFVFLILVFENILLYDKEGNIKVFWSRYI